MTWTKRLAWQSKSNINQAPGGYDLRRNISSHCACNRCTSTEYVLKTCSSGVPRLNILSSRVGTKYVQALTCQCSTSHMLCWRTEICHWTFARGRLKFGCNAPRASRPLTIGQLAFWTLLVIMRKWKLDVYISYLPFVKKIEQRMHFRQAFYWFSC